MEGESQAGDASVPLPVLSSERLALRPIVPGDSQVIRRLADDIDVARWMSRIPHPYGAADAERFVEETALGEAAWAIELLGQGLAGIGGFAPRWHRTDMEMGYWLGRAFWSRGIATEASGMMLRHAWRGGAARVRSGYFQGNLRSSRVLEKLGFAVVGRSTRSCLARGCDLPYVDVALARPTPPIA